MLKILILPILFAVHPVHVSLTTIEQAQGTDTMKVFIRMYYDDFLRDYKAFDPHSKIEQMDVDQSFPINMAEIYLTEKIQIYINGRLLTGKVLTLDILDNEIFMNLHYRSDKDPKKIKIRNKILTGLYSDQINMVFISINKNEQAMSLTPEHEKETWSFYK